MLELAIWIGVFIVIWIFTFQVLIHLRVLKEVKSASKVTLTGVEPIEKRLDR